MYFVKRNQRRRNDCLEIQPRLLVARGEELHVRLIGNHDVSQGVDELEVFGMSDFGEDLSDDVAVQIFDFEHQVVVQGVVAMEGIEQDGQVWNVGLEVMSDQRAIGAALRVQLSIAVPENEDLAAGHAEEIRSQDSRRWTRMHKAVGGSTVLHHGRQTALEERQR